MKVKQIYCLGLLSLSLLCHSTFAASEAINYKNERGSTLTLQFGENNTLTGTFTTAVASKDCQQAIGVKKPVVGYVAKNAVSFSVSYPECGSVVSFAGNLEKDQTMIDTTAIIVHQIKQANKDAPDTRMITHDLFTKIS